jgi:DNA adenine methylase
VKNNIESQIKAKPFLKWAGGKGQLLEQFAGFYPAGLKNREIEHFYEPFIGGGAVFFDVAQRYQIKSAGLYDINDELILTYKVVQEEVDSLIEQLDKLKRRYEKLNEAGQKEFYYGIRQDFNDNKSRVDFNRYSKKWVVRAAQIIFLNRTCFNGLFRFNSKGEFNVPQGSYKNPKILDGKNLQKASEILQIAEIKQGDFKQVEKDMKDHSFVYFDPPYRPISKTSGFTSYSANPFGDKEQIELSGLFHRLHKKGAKLMLSNSDPKHTDPEDNFFDDIYKDYHLSRVPAKRIINSDASKRQEINEIIVTNYPVF